MVQGYDSCFGCRRSRVQIPVWPFLFTFKIIANIMTPQWMMKNVLILCQRKKLYTQGTLGVEPRTCRTAAGCSTTELYPLLQATRPKTNQTPYNSPTIVFRMLTLANSKGKKIFVRSGICTHALIRGPEFSSLFLIREQGLILESGALDHSAILTCI